MRNRGPEGDRQLTEPLMRDVVGSLFVKTARLKEGLKDLGIKLKSDEALGVATIGSIQMELELAGHSKDDRRVIATEITRRLMGGVYSTIFPAPSQESVVSIKHPVAGEGFLFYRSGLRADEAAKRFEAYQELLRQEVEVKRLEKEEARKVKSAPKQTTPSVGTIKVAGFHTRKELDQSIEQGQQTAQSGVKYEPISYDFSPFQAPVSFLHRVDVQTILESGLTPEQLTVLLPQLRRNIALTQEDVTKFVQEAAISILGTASDKISLPGKDIRMPVLTPRPLVNTLADALAAINQNTALTIDRELPDVDLEVGFPHPQEFLVEKPDNLTDKTLVQAIYADVLGEVFIAPYLNGGERGEVALRALRYLTEKTPMSQIYRLLAPIEDKESPVEALKQQMGEIKDQLKSITGNGKEAAQRKAELVEQRTSLMLAFAKAPKGEKKKRIGEVIEWVVKAMAPKTKPVPDNYTKGERSIGHKEAIERAERLRAINPDFVVNDLDPSKYEEGVESRGYNEALNLYAAVFFVSHDGKDRQLRRSNWDFKTPHNLVSVVRDRLLE